MFDKFSRVFFLREAAYPVVVASLESGVAQTSGAWLIAQVYKFV